MSDVQNRPFGSWSSPFSAREIARGGRRLGQPHCHAGSIYWLEGRPEEGGRTVLRRWRDGQTETLTPAGYSLRSKAQEYGGGVWCPVDADERFFVEESDQGIHRQRGEAVEPLCRPEGLRFADLQWDARHGRILAIAEDHREAGLEPTAALVAIDPASGDIRTLAAGADFYTAPRPSPDGRGLAWVEWDHPDMPWDRTRLRVATLDEAGVPETVTTLTGEAPEAIFQPEWAPDGSLWFVSDRDNGWWNLYRHDEDGTEAVTDDMAELGMPWWSFNMRSWGLLDSRTAIAARTADGFWSLVRVDGDRMRVLDQTWDSIRHLHTDGEQAVMLAGRADHPLAVVRIDPARGAAEVLATASPPPPDDWPVSRPEAIAFPTGNGETAHALFYPPRNDRFRGPADGRPPLLVQCHGGPTGATDTAFDPRIQFWTSRGFAVADVNYRGSTGYGRAYRRRLYGEWGVLDVEDCVAVIDALAARNAIDPECCLISGSSAGGYTVLAALTFTDRFAAGASHYGIGDLAALDETTHKFESRYLDRLIGPLPEGRATRRERSPIHHVDRLAAPVIFFQGDEDRIVPPDQAERMAATLRDKGLPVAHVLFEGEGHGFRKAENIEAALAMELAFYGRVLGFEAADPDPGLQVDNL